MPKKHSEDDNQENLDPKVKKQINRQHRIHNQAVKNSKKSPPMPDGKPR